MFSEFLGSADAVMGMIYGRQQNIYFGSKGAKHAILYCISCFN